MISLQSRLDALDKSKEMAHLKVYTLGRFDLIRNGEKVSTKEWNRDHTLQLFQFMVLSRHRKALHKEQIIDRLWEDVDTKSGEQRFKVSMHGVNKVIEPERKKRTDTIYMVRQGASYYLDTSKVWIDIEACDQYIALANEALEEISNQIAKIGYQSAISLFKGTLLPDRIYNDWTSSERERIQILILGSIINLAEIHLPINPLETIRLTQQALQIEPTWEEAYSLQIQAYIKNGNRPMALKTYKLCAKIMDEEYGLNPLPETKKLVEKI